jgi:hypothetical protein
VNIMAKTENRNLPKLSDLTQDVKVAYKSDELNLLLNQEPPEKWVKEHPYVKNHMYIPIDKVELMLRRIFKRYRIEITAQGQSFNGVWVTVRVHFFHPVSGEWDFHDGIGAIQLQTKKGSTPADLANINNGALSMAYPHAKTLAIKDACDHFGKLFGADLNRKDTLAYTVDENLAEMSKREMSDKDFERAKDAIKKGHSSVKRLQELWRMSDEQFTALDNLELETKGL